MCVIPHFMETRQSRQATAFLAGSSPAPAWMCPSTVCPHPLLPINSHPESSCTLQPTTLMEKKNLNSPFSFFLLFFCDSFPGVLGIMSAGKRNTDLSLYSFPEVNSIVHWVLDMLCSGYILKASLPHTVYFYFVLLIKIAGLDVRAYQSFC